MLDSVAAYMDAARGNHGLSSDRALARLMKVAQMTVTRWRTAKHIPNEEQMRLLAKLAGVSEESALLQLGLWKAKDEPTRDVFRRLLCLVGSSGGTTLAVAATLALTAPAPESPEMNAPRTDRRAEFLPYALCDIWPSADRAIGDFPWLEIGVFP